VVIGVALAAGEIETVGDGKFALDEAATFDRITDAGEVSLGEIVELGRLQAVKPIELIPISNLKYFTLSNRGS
jgi:hypothetical protein